MGRRRNAWESRVTGASVYIVLCSDRSYYTGITRRSVEERVSEHNQGLDPDSYTFSRRPVRLVFSACFDRIVDAIATERRIKGWSRAKKEALIRGDYDALPKLAARRIVGRNNSGTPFETRPAGAPQGEGNCEVRKTEMSMVETEVIAAPILILRSPRSGRLEGWADEHDEQYESVNAREKRKLR
jgi:putative endonuclease